MILRHFTQNFIPDDKIYGALICGGITTVAVPSFFMVSGYLFFLKPFTLERLKHQLFRILRLYLVWTIVYLPLVVLKDYMDKKPLFDGLSEFVQNFFFSGSYYHLWFLTALLFALAFVSLIFSLKKRYAVIISVALFIIGLLFGDYNFLFPQLKDIVETYRSVFLTSRNGLFFGTIYVCLGGIFAQYDIKLKRSICILGSIVSMVLLLAESVFLFEFNGSSVANMTIFSLPLSVFAFGFAKQQNTEIQVEKLLFLRKLSTALFCLHPIFTGGFEFIGEHFIHIPVAFTFVMVFLGSTFLSVIIVKLSERFKFFSLFI